MFSHIMPRRGFIKILAGALLALLGMRCVRNASVVNAALPPAKNRVVSVHDDRASRAGKGMDNVDLDTAVVSEMVNRGVLAFTGESDLRRAWHKIIPDRSRKIAIKVNCQIRGVYTKAKVVKPLIEGMIASGIPAGNIIIYDMTDTAFDLAGFSRNTGSGVKVGTVADFGGYSRILFHRLANLLTGGHSNSGVNLLSSIIRTPGGRWDCDYLINVPVLKALDGYCGVTLSMKNHYGSIGNPSEHHEDIMEYIPTVNALPEIRNKTRLVVLDAIFGEYKWVNGRDQQYVSRVNKVLVSNDPVAVDYLGWKLIEDLRILNNLGPVQPPPHYIQRAAELGIGVADRSRMELLKIQL